MATSHAHATLHQRATPLLPLWQAKPSQTPSTSQQGFGNQINQLDSQIDHYDPPREEQTGHAQQACPTACWSLRLRNADRQAKRWAKAPFHWFPVISDEAWSELGKQSIAQQQVVGSTYLLLGMLSGLCTILAAGVGGVLGATVGLLQPPLASSKKTTEATWYKNYP